MADRHLISLLFIRFYYRNWISIEKNFEAELINSASFRLDNIFFSSVNKLCNLVNSWGFWHYKFWLMLSLNIKYVNNSYTVPYSYTLDKYSTSIIRINTYVYIGIHVCFVFSVFQSMHSIQISHQCGKVLKVIPVWTSNLWIYLPVNLIVAHDSWVKYCFKYLNFWKKLKLDSYVSCLVQVETKI